MLVAQCRLLLERRQLRCGEFEPLPQLERVEVVEFVVGIPHAVVGEIRRHGEQKMPV